MSTITLSPWLEEAAKKEALFDGGRIDQGRLDEELDKVGMDRAGFDELVSTQRREGQRERAETGNRRQLLEKQIQTANTRIKQLTARGEQLQKSTNREHRKENEKVWAEIEQAIIDRDRLQADLDQFQTA